MVRTGRDRLRYTCIFESLLVIILAPVGALVFERHVFDIGLLSLVLSLKAMVLNLVYNGLYDLIDVRAGRVPTERSVLGRVMHAVGFEVFLVLTSLPIVIWWLGLTLWQALLTDVVVTSFVVVYTFFFTWGYDLLYPIRQNADVSYAS